MRFEEKYPVKDIEPNEWNPNEMSERKYNALKESIKSGKKGIILLRERKDKKAQIVDGEHRWRAAQELKMDTFPCIIVDADETEAKLDTLRMGIKGEYNLVKLARLIIDLEGEGLTPEDLERELGFAPEELDAIKDVLDLPDVDNDPIPLDDDDEIPVEIIIALDPRQHDTFAEAIERALKFLGREKVDNVYPVTKEQIPAYDKAMKEAQRLKDTANRSKALEEVCKGFLKWAEGQKAVD